MFPNLKPTPAHPNAVALANAIIELIAANDALQNQKLQVPTYTDQWDRDDFYATEQQTWNNAADALRNLLILKLPYHP